MNNKLYKYLFMGTIGYIILALIAIEYVMDMHDEIKESREHIIVLDQIITDLTAHEECSLDLINNKTYILNVPE